MEIGTGVLLLALCGIVRISCGQMVEVDKRDLIAMIDAACPGYCSGRSSSATLQQLCTCPGNPNVFHWGKRNGAGLFNYKNVAVREEATKLDALAATFDEKMLSLLEKTTKQPSSESAGSDVGDQLRQLLEAVPLDAAADVTDKRLLQALLREPCLDRLAGEVNKHGMSILHVAAQRNNARFLQFFIKQQDVSSQQGFSLLQSRDNDGRLFYHPYGGSLVDVQILSSLKSKLTESQWVHLMMLTANDGKTCFHHAAQLLQVDAVELIGGSISSDKLWELLNKKDVKGLNPQIGRAHV